MDVVDRLKKDLCNFARKKLNASYTDIISLGKIVDKYNFDAGDVCGADINCLTIHNRVLVIRYNSEQYELEDLSGMARIMHENIKDNTTRIAYVPDDLTIESMSLEDFKLLIFRLCDMYSPDLKRFIFEHSEFGFRHSIYV